MVVNIARPLQFLVITALLLFPNFLKGQNLNLSNDIISENLPIGTFVGTLSDPGGVPRTYSILNPTGNFTIGGPSINQLFTAKIFDYEKESTLEVEIQGTAILGEAKVQETFVIEISDVNEAPVITGTISIQIPETTPIATSIYTINASDPEGEPLSFLFDSSISPNGHALFGFLDNTIIVAQN